MSSKILASQLLEKLKTCPPGRKDWRKYERLCARILDFLFVPPLEGPLSQLIGESGRKDLVLFIPYADIPIFWQCIHRDYNSNLVIVECKNLRRSINKNDVNRLANYLGTTRDLFGLIMCRRQSMSAMTQTKLLLRDASKLILCIDDYHVIDMIRLKQCGDQPEKVLGNLRRDLLISMG